MQCFRLRDHELSCLKTRVQHIWIVSKINDKLLEKFERQRKCISWKAGGGEGPHESQGSLWSGASWKPIGWPLPVATRCLVDDVDLDRLFAARWCSCLAVCAWAPLHWLIAASCCPDRQSSCCFVFHIDQSSQTTCDHLTLLEINGYCN